MIIRTILFFIKEIAIIVIKLASNTIPHLEAATLFFSTISAILSITNQALNFMYLIFGDTLFIVLPLIVTLLEMKYIAYPIIQILRSFFINSNE